MAKIPFPPKDTDQHISTEISVYTPIENIKNPQTPQRQERNHLDYNNPTASNTPIKRDTHIFPKWDTVPLNKNAFDANKENQHPRKTRKEIQSIKKPKQSPSGMKARFAKKLPLASAFADVPEETLSENLAAFQKRTQKMRDKANPLTMATAKPWFEPDDMDKVKATLALPKEEAKWGKWPLKVDLYTIQKLPSFGRTVHHDHIQNLTMPP